MVLKLKNKLWACDCAIRSCAGDGDDSMSDETISERTRREFLVVLPKGGDSA